MKDFEGPSFWHGRDINSCTRCKHLRSKLERSGKEPDYLFYCMHPSAMEAEYFKDHYDRILANIKALKPELYERFEAKLQKEKDERAVNGCFISNDENTPETPDWCPVVKLKTNSNK